MTRSELARRFADCLRLWHPTARYELDWTSPFELLVATVLAGGSKDSAVNAMSPALFARYPTAQALAAAEADEVEPLVESLGLKAQKANRLLAIARALVEEFGGQVPQTMAQLLELPGVGRKTANVVLTNAFAIASGVVVDVHVTRVARRLGLTALDQPDEIEAELMELLPQTAWIHFGAAAILHGRRVCTAKEPDCGACGMREVCPRVGLSGPVPVAKAPAAAMAPKASSAQPAAVTPRPVAQPAAEVVKIPWPDAWQIPARTAAAVSAVASEASGATSSDGATGATGLSASGLNSASGPSSASSSGDPNSASGPDSASGLSSAIDPGSASSDQNSPSEELMAKAKSPDSTSAASAGPNASAVPPAWAKALAATVQSDTYRELLERVAAERKEGPVYPPADEVFTALHLTPLAKTRVLILGQDPYHGPDQAHGLAFSVKPGIKPPPSLANIYKELATDVGAAKPSSGSLVPWAEQGVLLLNAVLTVRGGEPNSHQGYGWEALTDAIFQAVNALPTHVVFVLWGAWARKKAPLVDQARHTLVEGAHPSPLSAKLWFGSKPFSRIDAALKEHGQPPISWQLP